jgi:hypothetical protein
MNASADPSADLSADPSADPSADAAERLAFIRFAIEAGVLRFG